MRKLNLFGSMCLRLLHVTTLSFTLFHLVHAPCFLCPTAVAKRLTSSRWWISSDTIFLLFNVDSLDHQLYGCRPRSTFPFSTVPIISFILRADSAFSTAIFAFYFRLVMTEGWVFFTSGLQESCSIWKSSAFPNSYSSTSDSVGSFSFVDELYSATFVKELGTPNHFLINLLINRSTVSTFVSDTSYIYNCHANLGINPR